MVADKWRHEAVPLPPVYNMPIDLDVGIGLKVIDDTFKACP